MTRPQRRARSSRARRAACALSRSPARSRRGSRARASHQLKPLVRLSIEHGPSRTPELCDAERVFPCRAQRAPTTTSPALEEDAIKARASTVFGEDRRRAAPQGRAPASWGNPKRLAERIRANVTSGVAESREIRSNVEWQLSPRVSVEGSYDNVNDISSSSLGNLGADVRWRMEFE